VDRHTLSHLPEKGNSWRTLASPRFSDELEDVDDDEAGGEESRRKTANQRGRRYEAGPVPALDPEATKPRILLLPKHLLNSTRGPDLTSYTAVDEL
jgi:hypothetical protein